MPIITDMSQESAVALTGCVLETPSLGPVRVISAPQGFEVSQALYDCWDAIDLDTVTLPNCRSNNPCYSPACGGDDEQGPPWTVDAMTPMDFGMGQGPLTVTLTGTGFVAPLEGLFVAPDGSGWEVRPATVISPTEATVALTAADLDVAGFSTVGLRKGSEVNAAPGGTVFQATAGAPGTWNPFAPPNQTTPASLNTLGAMGNTTAWTTGQHVRLTDGTTHAYWNGSAWTAGDAP